MPATSRYSTPQGFHEVDINALRRDGFLVNGAVVTIRKCFGGQVIKEARARVLASVIKVEVDGKTHVIPIEHVAQPFGGARAWLTCPRCGRRAGKVYGAPFACRPCKQITYPSQRTDAHGRDHAGAKATDAPGRNGQPDRSYPRSALGHVGSDISEDGDEVRSRGRERDGLRGGRA